MVSRCKRRSFSAASPLAAGAWKMGAARVALSIGLAILAILAVGRPSRAAPSGAASFVDVCVGDAHSCAQRAPDGALFCWGDNGHHQVSPDDVAQIEAPQRIAGLPAARRVRCGPSATCLQTANGAVQCFGFRYEDATRVFRAAVPDSAPVTIAFAQPVREFVMVARGGCAILNDHSVACWHEENPLAPFAIEGVTDAEAFRPAPASVSGACVTRTGHPSVCIDFGGRDPVHPERGYPRHVTPLPARLPGDSPPSPLGAAAMLIDATSIALGPRHACAIVKGSVVCWGDASSGQLGDGTRYLHGPERVPGIDDAVGVTAGHGVVCAARKDGKLSCWGRSPSWAPSEDFVAVTVPTPQPVSDVVMGKLDLPCGRVGKAAPSCWSGAAWVPRAKLEGKSDDVFARAHAAVVARSADGVCGIDRKGRLGCATCPTCDGKAIRIVWTPAGAFVETTPVVEPRDGGKLVCARSSGKDAKGAKGAKGAKDQDGHDAGAVACFKLSEGPAARLEPVDAPALAALGDVTKLVGAKDEIPLVTSPHQASLICALTQPGAVHCWGDGRLGQLGAARARGPHGSIVEPVKIEGLPPATDIAVGGAFACATTAAGQVYCWGSNREGRAPNGAPRTRAMPVPVRWPPSP